MNADDFERELIERVLGRPVSGATRAGWGFTNRTDMVSLANGERVVVQRYRRRADAEYRLRAMRGLRTLAAQARIPLPRVRDYSLDGDPAWVIYDVLPGVPMPEAGEVGPGGPRFQQMARIMGELLAAFRRLPAAGLELDQRPRRPGGEHMNRSWFCRDHQADPSHLRHIRRISRDARDQRSSRYATGPQFMSEPSEYSWRTGERAGPAHGAQNIAIGRLQRTGPKEWFHYRIGRPCAMPAASDRHAARLISPSVSILIADSALWLPMAYRRSGAPIARLCFFACRLCTAVG